MLSTKPHVGSGEGSAEGVVNVDGLDREVKCLLMPVEAAYHLNFLQISFAPALKLYLRLQILIPFSLN